MHSHYLPVETLMRQVATDVVLPRFGTLAAADIEEKAADDFVTIADKEAELRLNQGLAAIMPDAAIVGEEACSADPNILDRAGQGLNWIVDPIDGTGNFAAARPPFGIMVALVDNGVTQAGWMLDPLTGRLCHAVRGGGAWIDGERFIARESGESRPIAALAVYFMTAEQRAEIVRRADGRLSLVDIPRCAAEQYPRLALGQNDIAIFERTLPWDHAAGTLFLNEAGGKVCRTDGSPYVVGDDRRGLLGASSPRMWDRAADLLYG